MEDQVVDEIWISLVVSQLLSSIGDSTEERLAQVLAPLDNKSIRVVLGGQAEGGRCIISVIKRGVAGTAKSLNSFAKELECLLEGTDDLRERGGGCDDDFGEFSSSDSFFG